MLSTSSARVNDYSHNVCILADVARVCHNEGGEWFSNTVRHSLRATTLRGGRSYLSRCATCKEPGTQHLALIHGELQLAAVHRRQVHRDAQVRRGAGGEVLAVVQHHAQRNGVPRLDRAANRVHAERRHRRLR